jgi:hypothetical protein
MLSEVDESLVDAETRFRRAFERLKAGEPKVVKRGLPVSQNNVAREAGCDTTALRKTRYPKLIGEIQAYVELHPEDAQPLGKTSKTRRANKSARDRLEEMRRQRDQAQSVLVCANLRILELTEQVHDLQGRLETSANVKIFPSRGGGTSQ